MTPDHYKWAREQGYSDDEITAQGYDLPNDPGSGNQAIGPKDTDPTGLKGAGRGFLDTATFGFSDEIAGAVRAAVPGGLDYRQGRDQARASMDAAKQASPKAFLGGQIAGGLATAAVPIGAAGRAASLGGAITKGAAVGAGSGALYGAGNAKEMENVPGDALVGGAVGGVVGGVVPGVVAGGKALVSPVVRGAKGAVQRMAPQSQLAQQLAARQLTSGGGRATAKAEGYLARQFGRDQVDLATIGAGAADDPRLMLNMGGRNVTRAAQTAQSIPSAATDELPNAIRGQLAGAGARTVKAIEGATGGRIASPKAYRQELTKAGSAKVRPLYKAMEQTAVQIDDDLAKLTGMEPGSQTTLKALDTMKRKMDRTVSALTKKEARSGIDGAEAEVLATTRQSRNALRDRLVGQFDDYRVALEKSAEYIKPREAFRAGEKFMRLGEDELGDLWGAMGDAEREQFRRGAGVAMRRATRSTKGSRNLEDRLIGSDELRGKLDMVFRDVPDQLEAITGALKKEGTLRRQATEALLPGQSITTPLREAVDDFRGSSVVPSDFIRGRQGIIAKAGQWLDDKWRRASTGLNEEAATEMGRILKAKPTSELAQRLIRRQMASQRDATLMARSGRAAGALAGGGSTRR